MPGQTYFVICDSYVGMNACLVEADNAQDALNTFRAEILPSRQGASPAAEAWLVYKVTEAQADTVGAWIAEGQPIGQRPEWLNVDLLATGLV